MKNHEKIENNEKIKSHEKTKNDENIKSYGRIREDIQKQLEDGETLLYYDEQRPPTMKEGLAPLLAGLFALSVIRSPYALAVRYLYEGRYSMVILAVVVLLVMLSLGLAFLVLGFLTALRPSPNYCFVTNRRLCLRTMNFFRQERFTNILPGTIRKVKAVPVSIQGVLTKAPPEGGTGNILSVIVFTVDNKQHTFTPTKDAQLMLDALRGLVF